MPRLSRNNGETLKTVKVRKFAPARWRIAKAKILKAREQCRDRELRLEAGERCAYADVRPAAKADMRIGSACEIEAIRIGERLRIAVRSAEHHGHHLPLLHRTAGDAAVALDDTLCSFGR